MSLRTSRPVNLNLLSMRFPLTAIVSILHRASGVLLFLAIPLLLWVLQTSLQGEEQFLGITDHLDHLVWKLVIWLVLSALLYHLVAGIRHLLMDMHIGESKQGGRCGAQAVLAISGLLMILCGAWLW